MYVFFACVYYRRTLLYFVDASQLDCSQYSNDFDVLRQLQFSVRLNLSMDEYYGFQKSAAQLNEDGISIERIVIKNEKLFPLSLFCLSNISILHIESTPFPDGEFVIGNSVSHPLQ